MGWKLKRRQIDEPEALPHFAIGPVASLEDVMEFDRKICAKGCKRFMRELTDFDFPTAHVQDQRQKGNRYIVVQEIHPGFRTRSTVSGYVIHWQDIPDHPERN
jgi:hypothetical protein